MDGLRKACVATAAVALFLMAGAAMASPGGTVSAPSFWIILDDRPDTAADAWDRPAFDEKARACGLDPYTTHSASLIGGAPARVLVVHLRAYAEKAEAKAALKAARRCVPKAKLIEGRIIFD